MSFRRSHSCPMCAGFVAPTFELLCSHVVRNHSNSPNFSLTCGYDGCMRTLSSFSAFKKHIQRRHRKGVSLATTLPIVENSDTIDQGDRINSDPLTDYDLCLHVDDEAADVSQEDLRKKNVARWLLKLKETRLLTQRALDGVLEDVTTLHTLTLSDLGLEVTTKLRQHGIDPASIPGLVELFQDSSPYSRPFDGLDTRYRQLSYYKEHFSLIMPVETKLGSTREWVSKGNKRLIVERNHTFAYVPILEVVEMMLKNDALYAQVQCGHKRSDSILEDFCDGEKAKHNALFATDKAALQILLYFDEVEVCNPIGDARKKHKLGCFYFTLGNIHPRFRSALKAIQLVALVKTENIKQYGVDSILEVIVNDLIKLEQGIAMETAEGKALIRGTIATFAGDNLGSQLVGGFKEGGSALRPCRVCMATSESMREKLQEKDFDLRTTEEHDRICALLDVLGADYHSTTYGINRQSILNSLKFYHVCSYGLPPDIMHDLLEGYIPYTLKLMLTEFISVRKYFQLSDLNHIISNFKYGLTDSKPQILSMSSLSTDESKTCLKMSASKIWSLARLLPLMIGKYIPQDVYWDHYLQLLEIVEYVFSPQLHHNVPAYLLCLIESNLTNFKDLYPSHSILPKMHYLLHLPRFLVKVGPLVRHWTMRYEAKHQYFKRLSSSMGNFINLPMSLAVRHQCYQCYMLNCDDTFEDHTEIGPGADIPVEVSIFKHQLHETRTVSNHQRLYRIGYESSCIDFRASWVKINGVHYKKGAVVVTNGLAEERDYPGLAIIEEVLVAQDQRALLGLKELEVQDYSEHHRSYIVHVTEQLTVKFVSELSSVQVLQLRQVLLSTSGTLCYCVTIKHSII